MDLIDKRQSTVIATMRFPLIVLVLFEHSVRGDLDPMRWSLDGANVFHFITELISHHICPIAVPCFFIFSGFLFFANLKEGQFDLRWLANKWKRRLRTLLIPYLFWNLFNVVAILLVSTLFNIFNFPVTSDPMSAVQQGPLFWFLTGPIDFPLWYLRDLIGLSLLAPLFYLLFKNIPRLSLLLMFGLYLFSAQGGFYPSFFFFGAGAWAAIQGKNFLVLCRSVNRPAALLAVALVVLSTCLYGRSYHRLVQLLFFPFGVITLVNICDRWVDFPKTKEILLKLSESVFFIYAAHEIYILGWTKGMFLRLFGDGLPGQWICYFAAPLLTMSICLFIYSFLKKTAPKVLSQTCGGRISCTTK